MNRNTLLVAGLAALALSLIGATTQTVVAGDVPWRGHMSGFGHMGSGYGHMGWWEDGTNAGDVIGGASEVEVTASDFGFAPAEITIEAGVPINLTLLNTGEVAHDLVITDLGVRIAAGPGQRATTGLEIAQAGSYQFLCSYPGHAAAGMTGTLNVGPKT